WAVCVEQADSAGGAVCDPVSDVADDRGCVVQVEGVVASGVRVPDAGGAGRHGGGADPVGVGQDERGGDCAGAAGADTNGDPGRGDLAVAQDAGRDAVDNPGGADEVGVRGAAAGGVEAAGGVVAAGGADPGQAAAGTGAGAGRGGIVVPE